MALSRIFVAPKNGQGGVKKSKKNFFSEKIFERWEKQILGPLGPYLHKIDFSGRLPDADPYPPLPPPDRPPVTSLLNTIFQYVDFEARAS